MPDRNMKQTKAVSMESEALADTKPQPRLEEIKAEELEHRQCELRVAQLSVVGAIRKRNEDSCLVFSSASGGHFPLLPFGLYLVADGMGGHEAGHLASKGASRAAAHYILERVFLPLLQKEDAPTGDEVEEITRDAVLAAHEAIYNPDPAHDGGTTLTLAVMLDKELFLAHVGDSRAYWLVDEQLKTLTNDHSLVQRMQDEGQISAEEAEEYQYRNVLLRALGQEDKLEVDTYRYALPKRGKLLLCSDGLCGLVRGPELQSIMNQPVPPEDTVERLIEAGMKAGGYDNITAVVVEFRF